MAQHRRQPPTWIDDADIVCHSTIEIEATPAQVWARIADHETWSEWFTTLDKVEVTGAPTGVGGARRATAGRIPLDEEFTVWNENEQFSFAIVKSPLLFLDALAEDIRIEPVGDGSRVVYRQGITGKRGFGWLAKLAFKSLESETSAGLVRLKALLEA